MNASAVEQASFEEHRSWLIGCGRDLEALDAAAESIVGVPNVDEALDRAREEADQLEKQAARWRGIARALEQVPADREILSSLSAS